MCLSKFYFEMKLKCRLNLGGLILTIYSNLVKLARLSSAQGKKIVAHNGVCKLCLSEAELQEGHIIPKFCLSLKKKQGDTFHRDTKEPDKRLQDLTKKYFLCWNCEQKFSKLESDFSTQNVLSAG